jgi:hypothetical protein
VDLIPKLFNLTKESNDSLWREWDLAHLEKYGVELDWISDSCLREKWEDWRRYKIAIVISIRAALVRIIPCVGDKIFIVELLIMCLHLKKKFFLLILMVLSALNFHLARAVKHLAVMLPIDLIHSCKQLPFFFYWILSFLIPFVFVNRQKVP